MGTPEGWMEPTADIKELADNLFQLFVALAASGFTEQQALVVVGHVLRAGAGS